MRSARHLLIAILLLFLYGCDAPEEGPGVDDRPDLARVGGVHDVWGFEFGMDADRKRVRSDLGSPVSISESSAPESASGLEVERWYYGGFQVTFLINVPEEYEHLLAVRIEDPQVPLRGGLRIGMPLDHALELLGEPRVVDGASYVYFYRDSTIEVVAPGTVVEAVQLSRALP